MNRECFKILKEHKEIVYSVAFSSDGKILASGSEDKTIKLWNLENLEMSQSCITLKGHTDKVYAVAFSQQKLILASGSADGIIKLWKLEKTQNGAVKLIENDENPQTLELLKPYHGMNISGIKGLNEAEKQQLINLGAKE